MTVEQRLFSKADRRSAFIAANGVCQQCGDDLPANFHADHVIPYSASGSTTLDNIQALCPACNLKKGATYESNPQVQKMIALREWQREAFVAWEKVSLPSGLPFLAQATPGAGKTIFACAVAKYLIDIGAVTRVVVVSPLSSLREAWAVGMAEFQIQLDPDCGSGIERNSDYIGKSTTYHALTESSASVERIKQYKEKTMVILDEVHHAGTNRAWGDALKEAFENAKYILCLSGTPFRTDGNKIPFIRYDNEGKALADYVYSYKSALADDPQVCRAVYFPAYEGAMEWMQDKIYKASFSDELDEKRESARLRAALWSGEWLDTTLKDAKDKLADIRTRHPDAAGLIVAMDKRHAEKIAQALEKITLSKPLIVTSDDKDATEQINAFRNKSDPWIIAIKMVSEGVDIKRLRVCVYLSNVITDLFLRQVIGRIVRYIPGIPCQDAFFFMPADRRLVEMALKFQDERDSGLLDDVPDEPPIGGEGDLEGGHFSGGSEIMVLSGESWHEKTISHTGDSYSREELESAANFAREGGYSVSAEVMAKMLRDFPAMRGPVQSNASNPEPIEPTVPAFKQAKDFKRATKGQEKGLINNLINRFLPMMKIEDAYAKLNGALNRSIGIKKKGDATKEQLKQRFQLLKDAVASKEVPTWLR